VNLADTHCHLDFEKYDPDRPEVLSRARAAGLSRILIPGLGPGSSRAAVKLAESDPMLFAAVGYHPTDADDFTETGFADIASFASHPRVVAIGEIGLDYYWVKEPARREHQKTTLARHLELAALASKPVVIHLREENDAEGGPAADDVLAVLIPWQQQLARNNHPLADRPGVLHSFSGDLPTARQAIAHGFYIGLTGPVTYKNAESRRELVRALPLDRLLIETDGPFLAPVPQRGKRNEPAFVRHIADKIAEIHQINPEQAAEITSANAARLFSWGG
jgi:TatD DNase family protein